MEQETNQPQPEQQEEQKEKKSLLFSFNLKGCLLVILNLLIVVGVAVGLIWFGLNKILPETTRHGQEITVPDVEDMNVEEAIKTLEEAKLRYEVNDTNYSAKHKPGAVIVQTPKGDSKVKEDRRIYLTINVQEIPTVTFSTKLKITETNLMEARNNLKKLKLGFAGVQRIESPYKDWVHACLINGDTVKVGDEIPLGTPVTLLAGNGKSATQEPEDSLEEMLELDPEE